jgi:acyl-[acyl carrier protein]--UDP-N-acetylglucosamine O-acyltransferase
MCQIDDYSLVYGGKCYGIVQFVCLNQNSIKLIITSSGKDISSFVIRKNESKVPLGLDSNYMIDPGTGKIPTWFIDFHSISEIQNHLKKSIK